MAVTAALVGTASDKELEASILNDKMFMIDRDQLGPAQGACETHDKQSAIAETA